MATLYCACLCPVGRCASIRSINLAVNLESMNLGAMATAAITSLSTSDKEARRWKNPNEVVKMRKKVRKLTAGSLKENV